MQTKIVYVLTCAEDTTYIEQALISIWSARYHNPDAQILLLVDDKTDDLLIGTRGELLNYISKKIVVPFEDTTLTPMYRSRWIKTQVRQMIEGDFLFIDSDTICQRPLTDLDNFNCEIGAVLESHLQVSEFCTSLYESTQKLCATIGVDIDVEQFYFSSGVLYVKDTKQTHRLYELWHQYWMEGNAKGLGIDQPSLAKANREIGHIIEQIQDSYNCILFTRPPFIRKAHILHIAAYQNPSFLFTHNVLTYIKKNGVENKYLQLLILSPCSTIMPFDYNLKYSSIRERFMWIGELSHAWKWYKTHIDVACEIFPNNTHLHKVIKLLIQYDYLKLAIWLYLLETRCHLYRKKIKHNVCQK